MGADWRDFLRCRHRIDALQNPSEPNYGVFADIGEQESRCGVIAAVLRPVSWLAITGSSVALSSVSCGKRLFPYWVISFRRWARCADVASVSYRTERMGSQ